MRRRITRLEIWLLVTLIAFIAVLSLFVIGTIKSFVPNANEIKADQKRMLEELKIMESDLAMMAQFVDKFEVIPITPTEPTAEYIGEPIETTVKEPVDEWLVKITALECDGSYEGALGVATVILNRLETGWGDTIHDVVSAPGQFSVYGSKRKPPITETIIKACEDAMSGIRAFGPDVQYFCTPKAYERSSFFQTLEVVDRYAGTVWCRKARR